MLVEIAGLPASGKTTLYQSLGRELKRRNVSFTDLSTLAAQPPEGKNVPRFVHSKPERNLLFRLTRFTAQNSEFFLSAEKSFGDATTKKFLFFLLAAQFQTAKDVGKTDNIIFTDEGFINHCLAIYPSKEQRSNLVKLVELAPKVDALFYLDISPEVAFNSAVDRVGGGIENRARIIQKFGDIDAFAERRENFLAAIDAYRRNDIHVTLINRSESLQQITLKVVDELIAMQA